MIKTPNTNKPIIILLLLWMLAITYAIDEYCFYPAVFNFGDSNSDTGGLSAAFTPPNTPYGETFFDTPVGRYSDGRLIIDFIAKSLNRPFLSAYLDTLGTNYIFGANFATSASTIRLPTSIIPRGLLSPFYLNIQYEQFKQFISRSKLGYNLGEALYLMDIGQNDLGGGFLIGNNTVAQVNASVPDIVNQFSTQVKNIYNLGARTFWIHNTGPIGCLPYILANFTSSEKDEAGCAKDYNGVAQYFNFMLKEAVTQLRKDLPSAAFTYVDIYSVKYSLFKDPQKYGFQLPNVACCGFGKNYNYSMVAGCGDRVTVNGTQIILDSACDNPSMRVNWDGIHYTEAANKVVFDQISTGAFSDPPVPLTKACQKSE